MVERLRSVYGAQVEWLAFYLRPDMPEEGQEVPAHVRAKRAQAGSRLQQLADAQGLPMVMSNWTPNTRKAHEATEYARQHGKLDEFHRVVFRQYFGEGQNIGQWDVLRAAASEVELDADDMQREVDAGTFRRTVEQQMQEAHELGINGVPTYIVNDRYAIVGAQPYRVFEDVVARLESEVQDDAEPGTVDP